MRGSAELSRIINELDTFLVARDLRLRDVVGCLADGLEGYVEQRDVPGRWRAFVPPETLSEADGEV